ncbi:hypothetical protein Sjap_002194 [Stephania japonica]|uniref:Cysteine-rich transmembrane domain-containing protein n=1 Tax=Stephania japonica TaxID=461633 RepID=A0AAP0KN81_9MAGN
MPRQDQCSKNNQNPPPGYPNEDDDNKKGCCFKFKRSSKKGDRGFIEGCLFALCCCWLCEACF